MKALSRCLRAAGFLMTILVPSYLFWPPRATAQTPSYAALITDISGTVIVQRSARTDPEKGIWGMQLGRGDRIRTKENAQVSLLFQNSNLITLGPNSSLTIADNSPAGTQKSLKSVTPDLASSLSLLTFSDSRGGEVEALAGLRGGNSGEDVTLLNPRNSKTRSPRPAFEWSVSRPHESYAVTLLADTGAVWRHRALGMNLEYPAAEAALERGRSYFWYVEAEDLFEARKSASAGFTVLSRVEMDSVEDQEQQVRLALGKDPESGSLRLILGAYYDRMGLAAEAISQFRNIAERNPGAPLPHEILGRLYEKAGLKDLAIRELQMAVALGKEIH